MVNLIGDSLATSSAARPTTRPSGEKFDDLPKSALPSVPSSRKIPFGLLYNSSKSENVIRELLDEFDSKYDKYYGEIICKKLGVDNFCEQDYKSLINPLLDLLASTGADYGRFFRALTNFSCNEVEYNEMVTYDPSEKHSKQNLRKTEPQDCLGLLLKALLVLIDSEEAYIQSEIKKIEDAGLNPYIPSLPRIEENEEIEPPKDAGYQTLDYESFPQLKPLPLPSLSDIAAAWKFWTMTYRARLMSNMGKSPEEIKQADAKRQKLLKSVNPKYTLRRCIIQDALREIRDSTPILALKKAQQAQIERE
jgi:uncharacterized protein YdiU (UPF0061 family)